MVTIVDFVAVNGGFFVEVEGALFVVEEEAKKRKQTVFRGN